MSSEVLYHFHNIFHLVIVPPPTAAQELKLFDGCPGRIASLAPGEADGDLPQGKSNAGMSIWLSVNLPPISWTLSSQLIR